MTRPVSSLMFAVPTKSMYMPRSLLSKMRSYGSITSFCSCSTGGRHGCLRHYPHRHQKAEAQLCTAHCRYAYCTPLAVSVESATTRPTCCLKVTSPAIFETLSHYLAPRLNLCVTVSMHLVCFAFAADSQTKQVPAYTRRRSAQCYRDAMAAHYCALHRQCLRPSRPLQKLPGH